MTIIDQYTHVPIVLEHELAQRRETGYDVSAVQARLPRPPAAPTSEQARQALDELATLPQAPDWPYVEPSTLDEIEAELPTHAATTSGPGELRDRIEAALLGRCAGNCLGKPVENGVYWTPDRLRDYLRLTGNYPITDYLTRPDPMPEGYRLNDSWTETTRGRITYAPRDDDLDYTLLNLHVLEDRGLGYTAADVAEAWLRLMPYRLTHTAERVTYRNLVAGVPPEQAATVDNPYREWVGAQIRADVFGYVHAGRPREAALLAFADASLSHVGNGIYGEMWAAALVAASFTAQSHRDAVLASIDHVPARSRLAEALHWVVSVHESGVGWERAVRMLHERFGRYHWVHTIINAAACALALLHSGDDFTRAVALTVQAGLDTDSNGATVGSAAGAFAGMAGIPANWTEPFDDTLYSALSGWARSSIHAVADRTFALTRAAATARG